MSDGRLLRLVPNHDKSTQTATYCAFSTSSVLIPACKVTLPLDRMSPIVSDRGDEAAGAPPWTAAQPSPLISYSYSAAAAEGAAAGRARAWILPEGEMRVPRSRASSTSSRARASTIITAAFLHRSQAFCALKTTACTPWLQRRTRPLLLSLPLPPTRSLQPRQAFLQSAH
jgi:hypothetical protein